MVCTVTLYYKTACFGLYSNFIFLPQNMILSLYCFSHLKVTLMIHYNINLVLHYVVTLYVTIMLLCCRAMIQTRYWSTPQTNKKSPSSPSNPRPLWSAERKRYCTPLTSISTVHSVLSHSYSALASSLLLQTRKISSRVRWLLKDSKTARDTEKVS